MIRGRLQGYVYNRRIKNFVSLLSGNVAAQVLNFFFYIYLSRNYTEIEFGFYSLFTSYVIFASVITNPQFPYLSMSMREDSAIEEIEEMSESFLFLSLLPVCIFSFISYYIFDTRLGGAILLLPIAVFLYTLIENRKVFHNQRENFRRSVSLTLIPRTMGNIVKILIVRINFFPHGLIGGELLGNAYVLFDGLPHFRKNLETIKVQLRRHRNFLFFNYPSTLATVAVTELLPFFLTALFSLKIAGIYFLFEKFVLQPFLLIGTSVGSSQSKYISGLNQNGKKRFFLKLLFFVLLISTPCIILILGFGVEILFYITQKNLFSSHLLSVLVFFIPVRLMKGIIYVFNHSTLNWEWSIVIRFSQVLALITSFFVCKKYELEISNFLAAFFFIEFFGEALLITKALTRKNLLS
jgi:O-antigen/teichoic acid export membrane protein